MKTAIFGAVMALTLLTGASAATAQTPTPTQTEANQDIIILDDGQDTVITGTVQSVRLNHIVVLSDNKEFRVEYDELGVGTRADEYFPEGSRVQVVGKLFDGDELKARKMIKMDDLPVPAVGAPVAVVPVQ